MTSNFADELILLTQVARDLQTTRVSSMYLLILVQLTIIAIFSICRVCRYLPERKSSSQMYYPCSGGVLGLVLGNIDNYPLVCIYHVQLCIGEITDYCEIREVVR